MTFGRKQLAVLFGAALAIASGLCLNTFRFGAGLSQLSYDLLLVSRGDMAPREAVIVYLDEESYEQLGQPLNAPWDRALHARLIDRLTQAGAKGIVFDIVFSDPTPSKAGADQLFADALKRYGHAILGADRVPIGRKGYKFTPPTDLLQTNAADMGSVEVVADPDLTARQHTRQLEVPSLGWAAAKVAGAGITLDPKAPDVKRWINYYGPPGAIAGVSYYRALDPNGVSDDFFRGKTVFIGSSLLTRFAGERKDEYRNPFAFWASGESASGRSALFISGVEIHATQFLNLVRGDWLRRLSPSSENCWLIVLGLLFGAGMVMLRPLAATGVALGGMLAVAATCHFLLRHELIWFPWLMVCVQAGLALSWSVLFNSVQLYVENRMWKQTLGLYLSPKLVKKFSRDPSLRKPGANKHELTLVFTDIADFTSISEGMDPDGLAAMMNRYFERVIVDCIHFTDGTVVKYLGDSVFAFWNAPDLQHDHAFRACEAALHFRKVEVKAAEGRLLRTRIGIHSGEANVGNFGSVERFDYTALGENVNLASRMEGLNKHLGTDCLISGATRDEIGDRLVTRMVGRFQLKGFEKPVEVYELVGWPAEAESSRLWREAFEQALRNYQARNFEFAAIGFRQTLTLRPDDGPSKYYLQRMEEIAHELVPEEGWTGATIMKEK